MSKQDYKPQYDLSKAVPYHLGNGVNLALKMQHFIEQKDLTSIAYWFDQCNKNQGAEFYGRDYRPYHNLFIAAIDSCLEHNNPEVIDFLLYDDLNKYKNKLEWKQLEKMGYMILYTNAKNDDILFKVANNA